MLHGRPAVRRLAVTWLAATAAALFAAPALTAAPAIIRVLPDDAAPSSSRHGNVGEVPSLEAAFELARQRRLTSPGDPAVIVEVAGGIHRLTVPVRLGPEDSGTPARPLIVRGAADGSSQIVGSVPLGRGTRPSPELLMRLPARSRDHVLVYALPNSAASASLADVTRRHADAVPPSPPFELFDRIGALEPARWPDRGWATVASAGNDETSASFVAAGARAHVWAAEPDLWAAGYWKQDWSFETRPVVAVDADRGSLTLAEPPHYGIARGARFFVYHALSELDRPGEWVRTPDRRSVVVWPRDGGGDIEVSVGESLFDLHGARNIRFENLWLGRTRGDAMRVRGGTGVVVADCTIASTGARGVVFDGAQRSGIERAVIADTGAGAVELSAGDRSGLVPAGLFVTGSSFLRAGRLGRTYQPAVRLGGVGNAVIGNLISDLPHAAIIFAGNDHLIELNEIARVVRETSDAGAIYTGRDWTARGTVIRNNFLHDIHGGNGFETKGVYLDDMASGIVVDGNLFLRVDQPVFIGGGRDNSVVDNLMVASEPAIHIDGRGTSWGKAAVEDADSELRRNLAAVPYQSPTWRDRYPALASILAEDPGAPSGNSSRGNVLVGTSLYDLEGSAREVAATLGPDLTMPVEGSGLSAFPAGLRRAADVARIVEGPAAAVPWPALPYRRMDREHLLSRGPGPVN